MTEKLSLRVRQKT